MLNLRKSKIGKDKGFLVYLENLVRTKDPVSDIKEHISTDEKRQSIRIYIEHPVEILLDVPGRPENIFPGTSINISESGILIGINAPTAVWEYINSHKDHINISYRFLEPEELGKNTIDGRIIRCNKKDETEEGTVSLELCIQNVTIRPEDLINLLQYINHLVIESINKDLSHIEGIKNARGLKEIEEKIYDFLLNERTERDQAF